MKICIVLHSVGLVKQQFFKRLYRPVGTISDIVPQAKSATVSNLVLHFIAASCANSKDDDTTCIYSRHNWR